jgi:hypothetical protein
MFLVKWPTPVLISNVPYDFEIVGFGSPKCEYCNAGVKLTVLPLIFVIITFSNYFGFMNEGAIAI